MLPDDAAIEELHTRLQSADDNKDGVLDVKVCSHLCPRLAHVSWHGQEFPKFYKKLTQARCVHLYPIVLLQNIAFLMSAILSRPTAT